VQDREVLLEYGNGVAILNNLISRGRGVGNSMTASVDILVMGNTIERQKHHGIQLHVDEGYNEEVQIVDNAIIRNGEAGVSIVDNNVVDTDADVTVQENTIRDNGGPGIDVENNTHALFLLDNLIHRNGDGGITLDNSTQVTVQDNVISDNRLDGVAAINGTSSVTIQNNDLIDNTRDGIFLEGSTTAISLDLNVARDNVEHDCHEETVPFVNFWALSNQGKNQNQPGLCNGAQTVQRLP
jgi:parallel beta-helix repeat protein